MGPAVLLIGIALPLTWKIAARHAAELGQRVGYLTAFNTLAAVMGSIGAGFVIVPWLGIGRGFAVIAATYGLLSMVAWLRVYEDHRRTTACGLVGLALAALFVMKLWVVVPIKRNADDRLIRYDEGEGATVAVFELSNGERFMTVNTHYSLGGTSPTAMALQQSQGRLPLGLHPMPSSAAFIGVATGISVSTILEFPVTRAVALELIPGVLDATVEFEIENRGVLHDERVQALVADGRNHLFATAEKFDVIVGDLFIPWEAGTGYLYTAEHFRNVAQHLKAGGIFAQWLPAYQLSLEEVRIIAATFADVFPTAELWLYDDQATPALALVGYADIRPDGCDPAPGGSPGRPENGRLKLVCKAARIRAWGRDAPLNTDEFPRIEYSAAISHLLRKPRDTADLVNAIMQLQRP